MQASVGGLECLEIGINQRREFVFIVADIGKKIQNSLTKFAHRRGETRVDYLPFQKFPQPLNRIEIGQVRGQEMQPNAAGLQVLSHLLRAVVAGLIQVEVNEGRSRIAVFDFLQPGNGTLARQWYFPHSSARKGQ